MKTTTMYAALVGVLVTVPLLAQEEESSEAPKAEAVAVKASMKNASFTSLPLCRRIEGLVEVCKPMGEWQLAEEGKYYPLGSAFRAGTESRLELAFGNDSAAIIENGSSFSTLAQAYGKPSRTLVLQSGVVDLKLADNLPEGAFFVTAKGFTVKNLVGESRYTMGQTVDGEKITVRCVTGSLGIQGRHFDIPVMRAADEVIIRSSHDFLSTQLSGTSGDYVVKLDQGLLSKDVIDDEGNRKTIAEPAVNEWHLSPATRIVINRSMPAIGSRMSVHTMAFDAAGERKSECYFCEGRAEVNSGELVVKEKTDGEELAKRAAEAAETTESADVEDESSEENSNTNTENSDSEEE